MEDNKAELYETRLQELCECMISNIGQTTDGTNIVLKGLDDSGWDHVYSLTSKWNLPDSECDEI